MQFWRGFAWVLFAIAFGLLVAVLVIGVEVAGQRNWIEIIGPFRLQPSEFAKLALVVWGASLLSQRNRRLDTWKGLLLPLLPVAVVMMVLVLLEGDFGNTLMLAAITMGMLFAAGAPMRLFAILAGAGVLGVVLLTLAAPYRMQRFTSWLDPERRPARLRLAGHPGPVRAGHRRLLGSRPRRQPREVGLAARGPHRLHLPGHRRGARAGRHA